MTTDTRQDIYDTFYDLINLRPKELEDWLDTPESKSVGDRSDGESTGHRSGRRIVKIKRTAKSELSDSDYEHMNKVIGYIKRHTAQRPSGEVEDTPWRYSLMNWGHDPLRSE